MMSTLRIQIRIRWVRGVPTVITRHGDGSWRVWRKLTEEARRRAANARHQRWLDRLARDD